MSRLPPKSFPLLVRAMFGGRRHRSSSHRQSTFHFPFVLSCFLTHLISIFIINCCVFNPLFPPCPCVELFVCKCLYTMLLVRYVTGTYLCSPASDFTATSSATLTEFHRIPHHPYGVSRSKCPWYRGRGARPGARGNDPPSRRRHGPR